MWIMFCVCKFLKEKAKNLLKIVGYIGQWSSLNLTNYLYLSRFDFLLEILINLLDL